MIDPRLAEHERRWQEKPVLRKIYTDLYRRMAASCVEGKTLEIGGGSGNFKKFWPDVVSTDILPTPWIEVAADAQSLPFADACFDNIVMFDVLHHIQRPRAFLMEARRILHKNGRLVLVEPAITPLSWVFYKLLHPEPIALGEDPLSEGPIDPGRDAFFANQAIPTLLFGRYRPHFAAAFPELSVLTRDFYSLFAYPLSGGFRRWSLIPVKAVDAVLALERLIMPVLGPLMAFRMLVVLERR